MALTPSGVYQLTGDKLRKLCSEEGLDADGPVRSLRQRLVCHLNVKAVVSRQDDETAQASVPTDLSADINQSGFQSSNQCSHACGSDNTNSVFVELLRQAPGLSTEEPEAILQLVSWLEEIDALGLIDDKGFITRILPLVSGALLRFFGGCLRNGRSWEQCKGDLLNEFFPHFVRERMIRDLIVFNFHEKGQSLRDYIDRVFAVAKFLGYGADEQQLVGRIIMNLHPSILAHTAFLDRAHSRGGTV